MVGTLTDQYLCDFCDANAEWIILYWRGKFAMYPTSKPSNEKAYMKYSLGRIIKGEDRRYCCYKHQRQAQDWGEAMIEKWKGNRKVKD